MVWLLQPASLPGCCSICRGREASSASSTVANFGLTSRVDLEMPRDTACESITSSEGRLQPSRWRRRAASYTSAGTLVSVDIESRPVSVTGSITCDVLCVTTDSDGVVEVAPPAFPVSRLSASCFGPSHRRSASLMRREDVSSGVDESNFTSSRAPSSCAKFPVPQRRFSLPPSKLPSSSACVGRFRDSKSGVAMIGEVPGA